MSNTVKWAAPEATASALTTELNSLATGSYSSASSAIANGTDLYLYISLELNVTYGTNPGTGAYVAVYLVTSIDGTNYEDGGGAVAPAVTREIATFPLRAVTTAQRVHATNIVIPPYGFKLVLFNSSGQTTASSGNTLKYARHNEAIV